MSYLEGAVEKAFRRLSPNRARGLKGWEFQIAKAAMQDDVDLPEWVTAAVKRDDDNDAWYEHVKRERKAWLKKGVVPCQSVQDYIVNGDFWTARSEHWHKTGVWLR